MFGSFQQFSRLGARLRSGVSAFAAYTLADRFTVPEYWVSGTQYGAGETTLLNTLLSSQQFDHANWIKTSATITANAVVAPDSTSTADKLTEAAATSPHYASQVVSVVGINTLSVFAKAAERSMVWLGQYADAVDHWAWFNLSTGALGGTAGPGITRTITPYPNGWYLCSLTVTAVASGVTVQIGVTTTDSVVSYAGDGASGIYLWQGQIVSGSVSGPIILTTAAPASSGVGRLPGYTFTRSGSQGTQNAAGAVAFYAANVPAINDLGYHAYGALTNNLLNAGGSGTLTTQNVTTTATPYTLAFIGTGTVTLSGTSVAGPLVGSGATNQVALNFTPTAGTLTLTVTGSVTYAVLVGGTFAAPGVPIIATTGVTASIGEGLLVHNIKSDASALADQDMLMIVRLAQYDVTGNAHPSQYYLDANNYATFRLLAGAVNAFIAVAGVGVYNQSVAGALTAGQDASMVLRRLGGDWRVGKVISGALTWGTSATATYPTGITKVGLGSNFLGGSPAQARLKTNALKLGTFTSDAEVLAAVAEAIA